MQREKPDREERRARRARRATAADPRRAARVGFFIPSSSNPTKGHKVPEGPLWAHEIKHDGFRFVCRKNGDRVHVFSRRRLDWTDGVPGMVEALRKLRATSVTLDGEGVVCREDGVSDFDLIRLAMARKSASGAFLYEGRDEAERQANVEEVRSGQADTRDLFVVTGVRRSPEWLG